MATIPKGAKGIFAVNDLTFTAVVLPGSGVQSMRMRRTAKSKTISNRAGITTGKTFYDPEESVSFDVVIVKNGSTEPADLLLAAIAQGAGATLTISDATDADAQHVGSWNVESFEASYANEDYVHASVECMRYPDGGNSAVTSAEA